MSSVNVWQETVHIPTYETGAQDIHPMFLENRVYQGSSGAVYPYGVTDTLSEDKTLKAWQAVWLENDYIKVMILPQLGGAYIARGIRSDSVISFITMMSSSLLWWDCLAHGFPGE